MLKVAILMTVHNRCATTMECLRNCYQQIDAMKGNDAYSFSVYMVDDGSVDGTSEAVGEAFPQTRIIRGSGILYWNQGMRLAWDTAAADGQDFYLWLKDDIVLEDKALAIIMETSAFLRHRAIVAASGENMAGMQVCGGRNRSGGLISPDPAIPVPCYTFDGNLVLVPSHAYKVLGNLDEHYRHRFGDLDYGARAAKAKVVRVVAAGVLYRVEQERMLPAWRDRSYPLRERIAYLCSPKGMPPHEQFRYDRRRKNVFFAVVHFVAIIVRVLFPLSKNLPDNEI